MYFDLFKASYGKCNNSKTAGNDKHQHHKAPKLYFHFKIHLQLFMYDKFTSMGELKRMLNSETGNKFSSECEER